MTTGTNYIILNAAYYKTDVPYVFFVRHFTEGVPSILVLSNTHSVMGHKNYQNKKNTLKATVCCHTCVLVMCIRSYIYRRLTWLPNSNRGIQPLLLALRRKL